MKLKITELHNSEIDLKRWDRCIEGAVNSRVFALSWFLDIACPDWHGIIVGDYDYVMPICPAQKFGIHYLMQPIYCQQLGIFPPATPDITQVFINHITQKYRYIDINFNAMNLLSTDWGTTEQRPNHLLSLNECYDVLKGNYSSHCKRHLKKAQKQVEIDSNLTVADYMKLKIQCSDKKLNQKYMSALKQIISKSISHGNGVIYGAFDEHNELCAAAFYLATPKRIIYMNGVSTNDGHHNHAMYAIMDRCITNYAQLPIQLDFEGSSIPGIARFLEGFGAKPETFPHFQLNRLPWILKLIKS